MPPLRHYNDPLFAWAASALPRQGSCAPAAPQEQPACQSDISCPPEWPAIWSVLSAHRGSAAAITAPAIAAAAGLWPDQSAANRGTHVRRVIELAQDAWPWPICGDVSGYYLAATADDLTHYCANLRGRAMAVLRRFASVRRAGRRAGFVYHGRGRWSSNPTTHARTA